METKPFTGRLTSKRLVVLVNELFDKYDINDFRCVEIVSTRFTSDQYEGGACKLYVYFNDLESMKNNTKNNRGCMMCFYFIKDIEDHLKNGYELFLYHNSRFGGRFPLLTEMELDLKRIN